MKDSDFNLSEEGFLDGNDFVSHETSLPNINDFILMIKGNIISFGSKDKITNEIENLLASNYKNSAIEDIVVLKRIEVKIGVSFDD